MRLLHVYAENFRSFEKLDWKIPTKGLHLLEGSNRDTGASNASGKSTLLDTVAWCLYGWLPKWEGPKGGPNDAVIMRGKKSCLVRVELEHAGRTVVVERRRPLRLSVTVDGLAREGKVEDLSRQIEELLMTPQRFLLTIYIHQGRRSSFFSMGDVERTSLMTVVSGLEGMDRAYLRSKDELAAKRKLMDAAMGFGKAIELEISEAPGRIERARARVEESNSLLAKAVEGFRESQSRLQSASDAASLQLNSRVAEIKGKLKEQRDELAARVADMNERRLYLVSQQKSEFRAPAEMYLRVGELKAQLGAAKASNSERARIILKNERISDNISRLVKKAEDMAGGKCAACGQDLPEWDRGAKTREIAAEAEALALTIQDPPEETDADALQLAVDELTRAIMETESTMNAAIVRDRGEIKILERHISELSEKERGLNYQEKAEVERAERAHKDQLRPLQQAEVEARHAVDMARQALESSEASLKESQERADELSKKLSEADANLIIISKEIDLLSDVVDLFGPKGYRTVCFDGLVGRIGERASQLVSVMTNGVYSTRLDMSKEDSKGNLRPALRPVVSKGGADLPDDDLSGGMARRFMLAYDVAVSDATAEGAPLFLDEALDGMDDASKAEAVTLLEEVAASRPVFVVDHTNETKGAFRSRVRVEYQGGVSRLVQ